MPMLCVIGIVGRLVMAVEENDCYSNVVCLVDIDGLIKVVVYWRRLTASNAKDNENYIFLLNYAVWLYHGILLFALAL